MKQEQIHITAEKHAELKKELERLSIDGRTRIAESLDSAKALGDLKENAEYHQAREDQAIMEDRINHIIAVLKNAKIIAPGSHAKVEIGATVNIARKGSSIKQTYQIVGPEEADPAGGKLSFDSPLVAAMMGKQENEFFKFKTPDGTQVEWKVVGVQ